MIPVFNCCPESSLEGTPYHNLRIPTKHACLHTSQELQILPSPHHCKDEWMVPRCPSNNLELMQNTCSPSCSSVASTITNSCLFSIINNIAHLSSVIATVPPHSRSPFVLPGKLKTSLVCFVSSHRLFYSAQEWFFFFLLKNKSHHASVYPEVSVAFHLLQDRPFMQRCLLPSLAELPFLPTLIPMHQPYWISCFFPQRDTFFCLQVFEHNVLFF